MRHDRITYDSTEPVKFRQWDGASHRYIGHGPKLEVWLAAASGALETVLCDTMQQAIQYFTAQPWARKVDHISLQGQGNSHFKFELYRTATGWVLPANGRPQ